MKDTILIQNIITPYRTRLFNSIAEKTDSLQIYYMAKTEPDRSWDISSIPLNHSYWLDKYGGYLSTKWYSCHINPILVLKVLFSRRIKNVILAGGAYHDPNIIALTIAKKMHLTKKRYFYWAEANYLNKFQKGESKIKTWLRKFVYGTTDGAIIIPGKMTEITMDKWGISDKPYIKLPNTINDLALTLDKTSSLCPHTPVFLVPIRLIEPIKGLLNFFNAIGVDNIKKAKFVIAGDGPDFDLYNNFIKRNNLDKHIKMMGFCQPAQMVKLYNESNVLLLPSFTDPSPLSLVEGLYYHLPILCSNTCGNHFEVVEESRNGFTFSPYNKNEIKSAYENLLKKIDEWEKFGEISYKKYKETFETEKVVARFIEQYNCYKK